MKNILAIIICILSATVMTGCLKDEGNYTYKEISAPTWLFDFQQIYIYQGDSVKYKSAFRFEKDSVERLANVRYEWKLNGVVISENRDLYESGDSIIKKLNLKEYPSDFLTGTFSVIEKSTGISYMYERLFNIYPRYSRGTWLVLSENGENSRLTCQLKKLKSGNNADYETIPDIYKQLNGSDIPGKPRRMLWHEARNISPAVGAMTILTDKAAYELNCETLLKSGELKDHFLDGTPDNLNISDVYYGKTTSFIATEDGRLFRRMMDDSWLGGKYLTEPYIVDERGSEVSHFGHGSNAQRDFGHGLGFPCYDEKNRRTLIISLYTPKGKILPVAPDKGEHPLKVWDMEAGTDILRLCRIRDIEGIDPWVGNDGYLMIYNQNNQTYISDFILNITPTANYALCLSNVRETKPFPGGNLDHESIFLTSLDNTPSWNGGTPWYRYVLYTKGNQLRYINRTANTDHLILTFDAKITAARYAAYTESYGTPQYSEIAIGLENGDFMTINVANVGAAYIIEKSKINVGGPVKEVAQISMPLGVDYY